jgi:branched-chain amino acid transport system substrate-binding protein
MINGILRPVELVFVNDNSSATEVKRATEHLVNDRGIKLLLGPYSSGLTAQAAAVAHQTGATIMSSGAASSYVFKGRPQVFGTSLPADKWLQPVIEMFAAMPEPRAQKIAYVQEDKTFTRLSCGDSLPGLISSYPHMTIVDGVTVSPGASETEIGNALTQIHASNPDVIFSCNYDLVCQRLIKKAKALNINPKAYVLTLCVATDEFRDLGLTGAFVFGTTAWTKDIPGKSLLTNFTAQQFYDRYLATFQESPHYVSASAFAASAVLINAIETSNSIDPKVVADAIKNTDVNTSYGRVRFDALGQCRMQMKIVQRQNLHDIKVASLVAPKDVEQKQPSYPRPTWSEINCTSPPRSSRLIQGLPEDTLTDWGYSNWSGMIGSCGKCNIAGEAGRYHPDLRKRICEECPVGQILRVLNGHKGSHKVCTQCAVGKFWCGKNWLPPSYASHTPMMIREEYLCNPNTVSKCLACPAGRYTDAQGLSVCKECSTGKYIDLPDKSRCISCQNNRQFAALTGSTNCTACPTGGLCLRTNDLYQGYTNADGYYLVRGFHPTEALVLGQLYKCPHGNGKACRRNNTCYRDEVANEISMYGPFCSSCKPGFAKGEAVQVCSKCGSAGKSWALAFSSQVLLFGVSCFMVICQMTRDPRYLLATHWIILRQFLNYIHLSTVIFPVTELSEAGNEVFRLLGAFQYLAASRSPQSAAHGAECFLQDISDMPVYQGWVTAGLFMVPCWIAFDVCFFALIWSLCRLSSWPTPRRGHLVTGIALNLYIIQPRLTKLFLEPFNCKYTDHIRLLSDMSVRCDSAEIFPWQVLGLFGLVCFSVGIPVSLIGVLYWYRRRSRLQSVECARTFGFLFHGLRPDCYYMEAVNMMRKVIFQMAAYLPWLTPVGENVLAQKALTSLSLLVLTVSFLGVHLRLKPYDSREYRILHSVEAAMLWAFLITCLSQTWLYMSNEFWIFTAAGGSNYMSRRSMRDFWVSTLVVLFHLRFFALALYGIFGRSFRLTEQYKRLAGGYEVQLNADANGMHVEGLNDASKMTLADTIGELAFNRISGKDLSSFRYSEFSDAMRRVCVEALYDKDRENFDKTVPFTERVVLSLLSMLPERFRGTTKLGKVADKLKNSIDEADAPWRLDPFYEYHPRDIDLASGHPYSVEDLQMVVVRLAWQRDADQTRNGSTPAPESCSKTLEVLPDNSQSSLRIAASSQDPAPADSAHYTLFGHPSTKRSRRAPSDDVDSDEVEEWG